MDLFDAERRLLKTCEGLHKEALKELRKSGFGDLVIAIEDYEEARLESRERELDE